jgi:hypothetical protein
MATTVKKPKANSKAARREAEFEVVEVPTALLLARAHLAELEHKAGLTTPAEESWARLKAARGLSV